MNNIRLISVLTGKWFFLSSKRNCCTIKLNVPFASLSSNIFLTHTFLFQTSFVVLSHLNLLLFSIKNKNTKNFLLLISYSIFLFSFYHLCICVLNLVWRRTRFKCEHLTENWATNLYTQVRTKLKWYIRHTARLVMPSVVITHQEVFLTQIVMKSEVSCP